MFLIQLFENLLLDLLLIFFIIIKEIVPLNKM